MSESTILISKSIRNILLAAFSGVIIRVTILNGLTSFEGNGIALSNFWSFYNIYMAITLCATIILFVGMLMKNHYYVIPYLVIIMVEIPLTSILLIFDVSFMVYSTSQRMFLELLLGLVLIFWNFFATWLLMFNYQYLEVQHAMKAHLEQLNDAPSQSERGESKC